MGRPAKMPDAATCAKIAKLRAEHGLTYPILSQRFDLSKVTVKKICDRKAKS
jgi:hypothetical protein